MSQTLWQGIMAARETVEVPATPTNKPSNETNATSAFCKREDIAVKPAEVIYLSTPTWTPMEPEDEARPHVRSILYLEQLRIAAVRQAAWIYDDFPLKQIAEHPINVLALDLERRKALLIGPTIKVVGEGGVVIRGAVPLRAMLASFQRVHDLIHVKPYVVQFRIKRNVDVERIKKLLDLFTTSKFLALKRGKPVSGNFTKDVFMYQAARCLGIHYTHINALRASLRATITSRILTTQELDTASSHIAISDPLMKHLANNLCHRRFKKEIPDIAAFEEWLHQKSNQGLKDIMADIDEKHKRRRQAIAKRKCDWRKDPVLLSWGEDVDGIYFIQDEDDSNARGVSD